MKRVSIINILLLLLLSPSNTMAVQPDTPPCSEPLQPYTSPRMQRAYFRSVESWTYCQRQNIKDIVELREEIRKLIDDPNMSDHLESLNASHARINRSLTNGYDLIKRVRDTMLGQIMTPKDEEQYHNGVGILDYSE